MHEVALVQALLDEVEEQVRGSGLRGQVRRVAVVIGVLSGVVPEAFQFAFEVLAPDVLGDGCELTIRESPAFCDCQECGVCSPIHELQYCCPNCGSVSIGLRGGRELLLESLEVEELPEDAAASQGDKPATDASPVDSQASEENQIANAQRTQGQECNVKKKASEVSHAHRCGQKDFAGE